MATSSKGAQTADLVVGRQHADQVVPMPIIKSVRDQHGLPTIAIAMMPKMMPPKRPNHKADAEGQERQERADHRIALGKEQLTEHQRSRRCHRGRSHTIRARSRRWRQGSRVSAIGRQRRL
jgi:hypothetical protein